MCISQLSSFVFVVLLCVGDMSCPPLLHRSTHIARVDGCHCYCNFIAVGVDWIFLAYL